MGVVRSRLWSPEVALPWGIRQREGEECSKRLGGVRGLNKEKKEPPLLIPNLPTAGYLPTAG